MPSTIIVDPDGDISLRLVREQPPDEIKKPDEDGIEAKGESEEPTEEVIRREPVTQELIVSSKILSVSSPVFKAMLSDKFKEGREFASTKQPSQPYTLTLHDDDIEAAILLCKILHFNLKLAETPTPECLEKLAFLCDKYQCTEAMRYYGIVWVRDWLLAHDSKTPQIDNLCRLLVFSYVIDLPYEYLSISWKLFLYHKGPLIGPHTDAGILIDHPLLLHDAVGVLSLHF